MRELFLPAIAAINQVQSPFATRTHPTLRDESSGNKFGHAIFPAAALIKLHTIIALGGGVERELNIYFPREGNSCAAAAWERNKIFFERDMLIALINRTSRRRRRQREGRVD
jgi:hypothetical protein